MLKQKLFLFIPVVLSMALSQTTIKPNDPTIQYFGRFDRTKPDRAAFDWPGVSIRAVFEGTSCQAVLEGTCCFDASVDGIGVGTIRATGPKAAYQIAQGLSDRTHKLVLVKRCETPTEPVVFWGFILDKDKKLVAPPERPVRKIEFIGDSYTAGYANEYQGTTCPSEKADSIICATTNTNKAFGPITARAFGAQYQVTAISGKGLIRNYAGINPGQELPAFYERTLISSVYGGQKGPLWDFAAWKADVAVVSIGINDFQDPKPIADAAKFEAAYATFLDRLRKLYPGVKIICCATRVWSSDALIPAVKKIVAGQQAAGKTDVVYFEFTSGNTALNGHPSVHDHQTIAESLIPVVSQATGWKRTDMTRGK
jgi:hypothetical protein